MKKLVWVVALCISAATSKAQNDEVTNAFFYQKNGQLDKAKEAIDKASVHEKTKEKSKTWYYKGLIYESIFRSPLPQVKALLGPDGAKLTYDAFAKTMELDKPGGEYYKNAKDKLEPLFLDILNDGIKNWQDKKFTESVASYEIAQAIKPADTTAFLYAIYSAEQLGDYDRVVKYSSRLLELGRKSPDYFITRYRLSKNAKNLERGLTDIQEGRKIFPDDKNLMLEELNLYFQLGKANEVKEKLESAIQADPTNANLYSVLGNLYDQESAEKTKTPAEKEALKKKALENYENALKLDPENFESNYNVGVYYFNRGAEITKKVNAMDLNTYQTKGKKLEEDSKKEFEKSIPYFEKCYKVNPADEGVKTSLRKVYGSLKREADAARIK